MDVRESEVHKTNEVTAEPVTSARRRKSVVREYAEAIAIAILLALVIRTLIVQAFTIPSGSMMDTLLVGDYILVNKFLYGPEMPMTEYRLPALRRPYRGDIIVFKYPQDEKRDFIKRIIGTPGDTVQVRGQQVFINGQALVEPYVRRTVPALPHSATPTFCGYAYACEPRRLHAVGRSVCMSMFRFVRSVAITARSTRRHSKMHRRCGDTCGRCARSSTCSPRRRGCRRFH